MSGPVRVLVVEDEGPARATLRTLVEEHPAATWAGECWGRDAVESIRELRPDVVLLDVQMPGMDGFEVLRAVEGDPLVEPVVVFVTAHEEHALEAFDVRAIDYLLKPFTDARFHTALERATERVAARRIGPTPVQSHGHAGPAAPDRLVFEDGGSTLVLPPSDIRWIEASGPYVVVHAVENEHLVRLTLASLEERLARWGFVRVHRSALVNLGAVRQVRPLGHGDAEVTLHDGTRLRVSRSRREAFEARLRG